MIDFIKNLKWKNLFQLSTLKAIAYILSALGLTVDTELINGISLVALSTMGGYDALKDEKAPKKNSFPGKASTSFMVLLSMAMVFGCASIDQSKWCSAVPDDSYSVICQVAEQVGTTPENVSTIAKASDLLLLNETHTAQQAWDFFTELEQKSKEIQALDGATYDQLVAYIAKKYVKLPAKVQAAIVLIKDFHGVDMSGSPIKLLSGYDWWMIDKALSDQKAVIVPFL